jgi:hypothetical protein
MSDRRAKGSNILRAAAAYFSMVFAAGFALGTIRTLLLVPRTGELAAVALELPMMLVISWYACGRALRRHPVPEGTASRAATGALAFMFLLVAELILTLTAFGGTPATFAASLVTRPGALGLAGQIAFALFPLFRRSR